MKENNPELHRIPRRGMFYLAGVTVVTLAGLDRLLISNNDGVEYDNPATFYPESSNLKLNEILNIGTAESNTLLFNYTNYHIGKRETEDLIRYYESIAKLSKTYNFEGLNFKLKPKSQKNHLVYLAPEQTTPPAWTHNLNVATAYGAENPFPTLTFIKAQAETPDIPLTFGNNITAINTSLAVELGQSLITVTDEAGEPNFFLQERFVNSIGNLYILKNILGDKVSSYDSAKQYLEDTGLVIIDGDNIATPYLIYPELYEAIPQTSLPIYSKQDTG